MEKTCSGCGVEKDVDHVIPLSKGGAHSMDNIKVSHALCNMRKGDKIQEPT